MAWPKKVAALLASLTTLSGLVICTGEHAGATTRPLFATVGTRAVVPSKATALGAVASTDPISVDLVLRPSHPSRLAALASAVSTPGSSKFRATLSPQEVATLSGVPKSTISAVEAALTSEGLKLRGVSTNHLLVAVRGSAKTIEHAFHTTLVDYRLSSGTVGYADSSAPAVPRTIVAHVAAIVGLDSLDAPAPNDLLEQSTSAATAVAHATDAPAPSATCAAQMSAAEAPTPGYGGVDNFTAPSFDTSNDLASAYGFDGLYAAGDLGAGTTIALIEFAPYLTSDIAAFQACYGTDTTVSTFAVDGGAGTAVTSGPGENIGGQEEAELDIEDIIGLAPKATIDVYEAPETAGDAQMLDAFSAAIANPAVRVISTSWGSCEAETDASLMKSETTLFEEAATEGKTIVAAAGDDGSEDCYGTEHGRQETALAVDNPASQPYVTGVGGTTFTGTSSKGAVVWNTDGGAGGGGVSSVFAMPSYQQDAPASLHVVNAYSACTSSSGDCREVPDVSADAGTPLGVYCTESGQEGCSPDGWTGFGGTSLAAPIWGALFALADANASCAGRPVGFANPSLYAIAASTKGADAFTDITSGDNDLGFNNGEYPATVGYDLASGLGTPLAANASGTGLVAQLCDASTLAAATPSVSGLRPIAGSVKGGVKVTILGTNLAGATGVDFGTKKATSFTVTSKSEIVAVAPAGTGTEPIRVTTPSGTSTVTTKADYSYLGVPVLRIVTPAIGAADGGTTVALHGSRFAAVTAVDFGKKKATSFKVASENEIIAVAPAGRGSVPVSVTTRGGTSSRRVATSFTYRG